MVEEPCHVARIGGDEFAVLMPARHERDGEELVQAIDNLVALNNQYYSGVALSFAMGTATGRPGERLEAVVRRADAAMYAKARLLFGFATRSPRFSDPAPKRDRLAIRAGPPE